jgi:hypothetical protein
VQALDPALSRRLSTSESTRLTKNEATEWTSMSPPASLRFLMPLMNALPTLRYDSTLNSSVTLTLMPSEIACSTAGTPASVPGILIIRFGRSTRSQYMRRASSVASVSCARSGSTSSDT